MSTRPSCAVAGCRHGSTLNQQEQVDAIQGYIERLDHHHLAFQIKYQISPTELGEYHRQSLQVTIDTLEQFWSEPQHARLIDAKLVHLSFAYATEAALYGQMGLSFRVAYLGTYLATWFKLGKERFLNVLRGNMPMESSTQQIILDLKTAMGKLGTDHEIVLFLSKQIPCSCLDESKKIAKEAPKTRRCFYCTSEGLKVEVKKCSQCKRVQYCSKECQTADWKEGHKKECEIYKLSHDEEVVFKAMRR
jgi:hypothetical protein